jgi:hypothetical protein
VELLVILLEDALVVVFPELLGRILAGDSLEDLLATCIAISCQWLVPSGLGLRLGAGRRARKQIITTYPDGHPGTL